MKVYIVIDDCTEVEGCKEVIPYACANKEAVKRKVKELYKQAQKDAGIDNEAIDNDWTEIGNVGWECEIKDDYACVDNDGTFREFIYVKEMEVIE